jgi:hypothetical protein
MILQKNPEKRIDILDLIEHPLIVKYSKITK